MIYINVIKPIPNSFSADIVIIAIMASAIDTKIPSQNMGYEIAISLIKNLPIVNENNVFGEHVSIHTDDTNQILTIYRIATDKWTVDLERDTKDSDTRYFDYTKCCEFIKDCGNIIITEFCYMKMGKRGKYNTSMIIWKSC